MIKSPLISVVVPVYNAAKYLPRCVKSLQAQTHPNLEIILVDDGSKDNSPQLCDEFAAQDPRVKVFHKPNGGVSSARNVGLDNARGEYIGFVDADDEVHPQMYEILLDNLEKHQADVSVVRLAVTEDDSTPPPLRFVQKQAVLLTSPDEFLAALEHPLIPLQRAIWNKLYRRNLIKNIRFDTRLTWAEDLLFLLQIAPSLRKAVLLPHELYGYYRVENSLTGSLKLSRLLNSSNVMQQFVRLCEEKNYKKSLPLARRYLCMESTVLAFTLCFVDRKHKYRALFDKQLAHLRTVKSEIPFLPTRKLRMIARVLLLAPALLRRMAQIPQVAALFNRRHHFDKYDLSL